MDNTFRERELSINWRLRLELYVKDSIRKLSGQKTSSELIAAALVCMPVNMSNPPGVMST